MDLFIEWGLLGLFLAAFLAATILPLSSELVLVGLLSAGLNPASLLAVATVGNVLGSIVNYALGFWLSLQLVKRWLRISDEEFERAEHRFQKYGLLSLCFAWVPVIGDPITLVAGVLRVRFLWFCLLVTLGKSARYVLLVYLVG